jgi:hypothetical protein
VELKFSWELGAYGEGRERAEWKSSPEVEEGGRGGVGRKAGWQGPPPSRHFNNLISIKRTFPAIKILLKLPAA